MTTTTLSASTTTTGVNIASGDDGTLTLKTGATAGAQVNALSFAADGTPTFLKVPANTAVQSMVRVNTANGYGSTNTKIRRFTNTVTNQGTDITYADSATLGATFTINTNGVYAISYNDQFGASTWLGLTLNSTQLTTNLLSVTTADILAAVAATSLNSAVFVGVTVYLAAGAVVRAHTQGDGTGTNPNICQFTITRVA